MDPGTAIMSFGLPLLLAVVVLAIGWKLWEKPRHAKPPYWPPPTAFGLGVLLAFVIQEGLPSIPVSQKWHSMLPALFAVTVIGATHRVFPRRRSLRFIPEMATAFIAAFAMGFPGQDSMEAKLVIGIGTLLATMAGRTYILRRPAWVLPVIAWMIYATLSVMILQGYFAKLTIIAGAASMIAAALAVCVLIRKPATLSAGTSCVLGFLAVAMAACGDAYDSSDAIPTPCWWLPVVALPAAAVASAMFSDLRQRRHSVVAIAVAALCCLTAVIWTLATKAPAPLPY